MRRLILLLVFLIASVWFGIHIMRHPGYLFIVYEPWSVQMPLWFAFVTVLLTLVVLYYIITGFDHLQFLWFRFKNWLRFRREHRAYSKTRHGLTLLIEGQWKKAEKLLLSGVQQETEPFLNYLGVAKIAEEQGDFAKATIYLEKAHVVLPEADLAIGIVRATWQLKHHQCEEARVTLRRLKAMSPYHPEVLKLFERLYTQLGEWDNLEQLVPLLRKARVLTKENAALLSQRVAIELLNHLTIESVTALRARFQVMPRGLRADPLVVLAYVKRLVAFGETDTVEGLIRQTLKSHWDPELVLLYGKLPFAALNKQYVIVGAWLKQYGAHPELYLTLARLCMRGQLWGKAKDYFEKCLDLGANRDASLELGELYEQLAEPELAKSAYRAGLQA